MQKPQMRVGPIETSNSDAKVKDLNAQNYRWWLGPIEICNSDLTVAVLHAQTTDEGWDQ